MTRVTRPAGTTLATALGRSAAAAALLVLWLPLVAVAVYSFNRARVGFEWQGFTLDWYARLPHDEAVRHAVLDTAILAVVSTAIATLLGTMLAIALDRYPKPRWAERILDLAVDLPIVTPDIVFAAALVIAFSFARARWNVFQPGLVTMILGHVTFQISFVALVVRSRLALLGPTLSEAAHDLNATPATVFRRVTLPLIAPAIAAGAVLAFTLSLDDFVISFFTAGPKSDTLPIYIYSSMRRGLSPEIHALSTGVIALTTILVLTLDRANPHRVADRDAPHS